MSKYTPGPWMIWDLRHQKNGQIRIQPDRRVVDSVEDVCNVFARTSGCEANARLIAAAPELLEAAKFFVEFSGATKHTGDAIVAKHLAAIAKAEGGGE
jgi:hypothetical protein